MKYLVIVICLSLINCSPTLFVKGDALTFVEKVGPIKLDEIRLNIINGTALAEHQDKLIEDYKAGKEISKETLDSLDNNIWIAAAKTLCPGNLVIRQWCLVDLISKTADTTRLITAIKLLSYDEMNNGHIWAEGYSYWLYVKYFLIEWLKVFENSTIQIFVNDIDTGFIKTAYLRDTTWYPATFGDVRDIPLEHELQNTIKGCYSCAIAIVEKIITDTIVQYNITGAPIGLNTHININSTEINIVDGLPKNFVFYEGYDKKYKSKKEEWLDILNMKRIGNIKW